MRRFNVTGVCVPEKHYMVDISGKLSIIKEMVDYGDYFAINRARQYGKTTTLSLLEKMLEGEYIVVSISFEGLGDESFETSAAFSRAFMKAVQRALSFTDASEKYKQSWLDEDVMDFDELSHHITEMCNPDSVGFDKKLVLMIDEVDKASNNRTFIHFMGILRDKYLKREQKRDHTFKSVILAGVYDIKNIKLKMINEGIHMPAAAENKIYNSPWNIAADFEVDMSFNPAEIATMLADYETENNTGMDIRLIADELYGYTSGYPYLVSRICKHIDEKLSKDWTPDGVREAVKIIRTEKTTLSDDMIKNLENSAELHGFTHSLLIEGETKRYIIHDPVIESGVRYGFFSNAGGTVAISNRIFELLMADYFISKDLRGKKHVNGVLQRDIVQGSRFDMELCLCKFAEHYAKIFNNDDIEFLEKHGRLIFLSYLLPLINGEGFYHMESQLTDLRRMDLVVDYGKDQFILELKIWRGVQYEKEALEQLCGYLDSKGADTGYLLAFDFRKSENKTPKTEWVEINGKRIFETMV